MIDNLLRKNILALEPYSCARDEFKGTASVYLDANENPYNAPFNRYPDPLQIELKHHISKVKGVNPQNIFIGNGSDEPIDLLYRAFCEPRQDNVVAMDPTYGMYKVAASINDVEYRKVLLNEVFDIQADKLLAATDNRTKLLWLCSPNNPTGNNLNRQEIEKILSEFKGIVVIDEAYIDFSSAESFTKVLSLYPRLVILQTLSKAWAHAGIRLGMAFASEKIILTLNKIKYPYNIGFLTQNQAISVLKEEQKIKSWVNILLKERKQLIDKLLAIPQIEKVFPTDANFVLVKLPKANDIYKKLIDNGVVVRNRSSISLCMDCLRVTVGTSHENESFVNELTRILLQK